MTEISNEHINKLGSKAEDLVTGFAGVITLVSFDLYGCVQMVLTPKVDKSGKTIDGRWFDVTRLKMKSKNALLSVPKYNSDLIIGNLGLKAKDTITGFSGIVSSVGFNLYGDAQFTLSQKINSAGELNESNWFNITRIKVKNKTPVMPLPDFKKGYIAEGKKGPAEKTIPNE